MENKNVKLTKAQKFELIKAIPEVASNDMLVEFIEKEIESLKKKNSANGKPTAQQVENVAIKSAILEAMQENPAMMYTITDIIKNVDKCADLTNQRVSALVNQMVADNLVEKVIDKRKSYFKYLASGVESDEE